MRGCVPAGTSVGKPATVSPTPSPISFCPFFSAMLSVSGVVAVRPLKTKIVELGPDAACASASVSKASVERPSLPGGLFGPVSLFTYQTTSPTVMFTVTATGVMESVTWTVNVSMPLKPASGTYVNDPLAASVIVPSPVSKLVSGTAAGATGPSMSIGPDFTSTPLASLTAARPGSVAPCTCSCVLPTVLYAIVALVRVGASLTGVTVIVNVCGADVSTPPLAVPPLSWRTT